MTVTSPSSIESDTVIPGPSNRGNTVPSSPRSPGIEFAPISPSGSPRRGKSSSGSQSPVYEQWASTELSGRSKGTGTSDHPELLLPPGWEEAMAEMAKEQEVKDGKEVPVTVKDSGSSGVGRDEVKTWNSNKPF